MQAHLGICENPIVDAYLFSRSQELERQGFRVQLRVLLPEATGISDPDLIIAFANLLDNAAKHGGAGKRIDVGIRQDVLDAVITIRDYGPGVPQEELPFIKNKFYKGSSKARGSGIGLAVCEEIITRHEGTLDIGNAEGGGCLVTIRLPIEA